MEFPVISFLALGPSPAASAHPDVGDSGKHPHCSAEQSTPPVAETPHCSVDSLGEDPPVAPTSSPVINFNRFYFFQFDRLQKATKTQPSFPAPSLTQCAGLPGAQQGECTLGIPPGVPEMPLTGDGSHWEPGFLLPHSATWWPSVVTT